MKSAREPRRQSKEQVLNRLAGLCSRSEQCSADILVKLRRTTLTADEQSEIMDTLTAVGFVDDARYARSFANDKVRFSGWGRRKISMHLAAKRISRELIDEALAGIEADDYKEALIRTARAKARTLDVSDREDRVKLLRHLASRGFEPQLCIRVVEAIERRLP